MVDLSWVPLNCPDGMNLLYIRIVGDAGDWPETRLAMVPGTVLEHRMYNGAVLNSEPQLIQLDEHYFDGLPDNQVSLPEGTLAYDPEAASWIPAYWLRYNGKTV